MAIRWVESGDIREDPSDVLVLACNCVPGILGKGQALAFKERWPGLVECHRSGVNCGALHPGRGFMTWLRGEPSRQPDDMLGIYFLPTKDDWRNPGRLEWVAGGLDGLVRDLGEFASPHYRRPVRSVALPALGCGLAGLRWEDVRPLIEAAAGRTPELAWSVYLPGAERAA